MAQDRNIDDAQQKEHLIWEGIFAIEDNFNMLQKWVGRNRPLLEKHNILSPIENSLNQINREHQLTNTLEERKGHSIIRQMILMEVGNILNETDTSTDEDAEIKDMRKNLNSLNKLNQMQVAFWALSPYSSSAATSQSPQAPNNSPKNNG